MTKRLILTVNSPPGARVEFDHVAPAAKPGSVAALTAHILNLAKLDPVTLSRLMATPMGNRFMGGARMEGVTDADLRSHIDALPEASPEPLSEEQYVAFLAGDARAPRG